MGLLPTLLPGYHERQSQAKFSQSIDIYQLASTEQSHNLFWKLKEVPALCSFKWSSSTWPEDSLDRCLSIWLIICILNLGGGAKGVGVAHPKEKLLPGGGVGRGWVMTQQIGTDSHC